MKYVISVIIPCYNYGYLLSKAIESVINQSTKRVEYDIIVIDDGSTDETNIVAEKYKGKIRYFYQKNKG